MENYTNFKKLGKGAQGQVYLATHIEDKKNYVLKKVECSDENDANKAFQEAMALQELKHQNICGYKEFFVTWDKDEAAMFVCIVMHFYPSGDLANLLVKKRKAKENIEEIVLKKWIAQMIDALVYVHKKSIIHRDLKPSNLFLTSDLSISIGDFGVSTQLGEERIKTRTTVGSMNWMAPEVLERPYDERSDVWSLGCIMLESCTCSFLDKDEISDVLFDLKSSSQSLEEVLKRVQKAGYSVGLVNTIRSMLTINFPQRPTAEELLQYPYIAVCMELLDAKHSKLSQQKPDNKLLMKRRGSVQGPSEDLPKTVDPKRIGVWLKENLQTTQTTQALENMLNLLNKNKRVNNEVKQTIVKVVHANTANTSILTKASEVLAHLAVNSLEEEDSLCTENSMKVILFAARANMQNKALQQNTLTIIQAIGADENDAITLGKLGALQDTLVILRKYGVSDHKLASSCCHVIWTLCVLEENSKIASTEKAVEDIKEVLSEHGTRSAVLAEHAASAVWCLSLIEDEHQTEYLVEQTVHLLMDSLKKFITNYNVVKSVFMALASIAGSSDSGSCRIIDPGSHIGQTRDGIQECINAYNKCSRDEQVNENFSLLLAELSGCKYVRDDLKNSKYNLDTLSKNISKKFSNNDEIVDNVNSFNKSVFKIKKKK